MLSTILLVVIPHPTSLSGSIYNNTGNIQGHSWRYRWQDLLEYALNFYHMVSSNRKQEACSSNNFYVLGRNLSAAILSITIPHGLSWDLTQTSMMTGQSLTTTAMLQPDKFMVHNSILQDMQYKCRKNSRKMLSSFEAMPEKF